MEVKKIALETLCKLVGSNAWDFFYPGYKFVLLDPNTELRSRAWQLLVDPIYEGADKYFELIIREGCYTGFFISGGLEFARSLQANKNPISQELYFRFL